ncbi:MAG: Ig-like domain-containing protein [Thermoplasmata archaeon]|nr:MAG: Ig-like domain-containing protein [Thermoplasmata archaeon]
MQIIPLNSNILLSASAASTWTQETEQDFNNGTLANAEVRIEGEVILDIQINEIVDQFNDKSRIALNKTVIVDISGGEVKFNKFNKTFGGSDYDYGYGILQTPDGGYIITGTTASFGANGYDVLLMKTDSEGNELWRKTYGGIGTDMGRSVQQTSDGGYIIGGYTYLFGNFDVWLIKTDSSGNEQWNQTFGTKYDDYGRSVLQTGDGGYIIAGYTWSYGMNATFRPNVWLIKTNSTGNESWNQTYGGEDFDFGFYANQTSDGGFVITGYTRSFGKGINDVWLIKTNSTGNESWNRTFGGSGYNYGYCVKQTPDGGFVIAGDTQWYGAGGTDVWLIKTNDTGIEVWNKTYGSSKLDEGRSVVLTRDGGYFITGTTTSDNSFKEVMLIKTDSYGNELWVRTMGGYSNDEGYFGLEVGEDEYIAMANIGSYGAGLIDIWLFKVDSSGYMELNNTFGGASDDFGYSVQPATNGGNIIAGSTDSYSAGGFDVWLMKSDEFGSEVWNRTFGGGSDDFGASVQATREGGYIIAGSTYSYGAGTPGCSNVWLIKTDEDGIESWNRTFGGSNYDNASAVQQAGDGGYILAGSTQSYGGADSDVWLIKTDSSGVEMWNKTFGGGNFEEGSCVQQTRDGGYIISGSTYSYGNNTPNKPNVWLIKTDSSGNAEWIKTFGGNQSDTANFVQQTQDNGYVITGQTGSYGLNTPVTSNIWLIKTNSSGSESWNRTYGGVNNDTGNSVQQICDGGYFITGTTYSYGAGTPNHSNAILFKTNSMGDIKCYKVFGGPQNDSGNFGFLSPNGYYTMTGTTFSYGSGAPDSPDAWLIKSKASSGVLISKNLLAGNEACSIDNITCNIIKPPGTGLQLQFSQDNLNWYNSSGLINNRDFLDNGFNFINLSSLKWNGSSFYYRALFISDTTDTPVLSDITLSFQRYGPSGTIQCKPFSPGVTPYWQKLNWTAGEPPGTDIKFQLRSAASSILLGFKNFIGPGGSTSAYYTNSDTTIWSGHGNDAWFQWKAYLSTTNGTRTPTLQSVTVTYNRFPNQPTLTNPADNSWTSDSTPTFTWKFNDSDGTQAGFQVIIDDKSDFSSINYDSGIVNSASASYTHGSTISDGSWYWKVRTKDNDGNWSQYSSYRTIKIDTGAPNAITISADPSDWTNNIEPVITFSTTDALSGVDHYEVKVGSGSFSEQTSPYKLPPQPDGVHTVTVRAVDLVGNFRDDYIEVKIDTVQPVNFNPTAVPDGWTSDTQPIISFSTTDDRCGMDIYEISIDHGTYTEVTSPYTLPVQSEGVHNITVKANDKAGNYRYGYVDVKIDTSPPLDFVVAANPADWTVNTRPEITFSTTDSVSGIDHYEVCIDLGSFSIQTSPYKLPQQTDGVHNVSVRAMDNAGNYLERDTMVYIDTAPPTIEHTPVVTANIGSSIKIEATVTDEDSGVYFVELYYMKSIDLYYSTLTMIKSGDKYSTEIPGSVATSDGVHYYLKAMDKTDPGNIAYYGASGQTTIKPDTTNVIKITVIELDITPPTVIEKSPVGTDIPISTEISVTFNEEMDTSISDIIVLSPEVIGTSRWEGTTKFVFQPDFALDYSTQYAVSVKTTARDIAGNYLETEYKWLFMTTPGQDTTRPEIIDYSPTGMDVPVETVVTIVFSEPMLTAATENAFFIEPEVDGVFEWIGNTLIFTPDSPLDYEKEYAIGISNDASDLVGNKLVVLLGWNFITEAEPDQQYVRVTKNQPTGDDVSFDEKIIITFTEAMDEDTTLDAFSIYPEVDGELEVDGKRLIFTPSTSLDYDTEYIVRISRSAKSTDGKKLNGTFEWEFTTEEDPDQDNGKEEEKSLLESGAFVVTIIVVPIIIVIIIILFILFRMRGSGPEYEDAEPVERYRAPPPPPPPPPPPEQYY